MLLPALLLRLLRFLLRFLLRLWLGLRRLRGQLLRVLLLRIWLRGRRGLRGDGAAGSRGGISPCEGATPPTGMERESVGL